VGLASTLELSGRVPGDEDLIGELIPAVGSGCLAIGVHSTPELLELGGFFDGLEDRSGVDEQLERIRHQASEVL
jgi:hypothetical protein